MKQGRRRRGGSRRHRARITPKWLLKSGEIDRLAQERCLMVLSVLSGEKPVTDAIAEAGISRATYYQLETRALNAVLKALGPLGSTESSSTSPAHQIALLEAKVKELERARRRSERLLLMTRRVMKAPARKTDSIPRGSDRLRASRKAKKAKEPKRPSTPTPAGVIAP
jgi:hypothetical protein